MTTLVADVREMMQAWDSLMAQARAQFPGAQEEEIFVICSNAMACSLGLKPPTVKPPPAPKDPRIYSALQFTPQPGGRVSYVQIEVAACSQGEAVNLMRLDGIKGELFVLTDEAVRRSKPCKTRDASDRWDRPTLEEHIRWVRLQTRGFMDSGAYVGPTYTRYYLGPVAAPKPAH